MLLIATVLETDTAFNRIRARSKLLIRYDDIWFENYYRRIAEWEHI